jgi:FKBP-type peptidyl-prolyl cis-trans isomerase
LAEEIHQVIFWSWLDVPATLADAPATMNHFKKIKSLLIVSAAAVALTGCSGSDQGSGSATNAASASPAVPPAGAMDAKAAGEAFLAANAKKDGVITTPSGLQYMVIKSGTGDSPKATDTVTVHYTGTLIDGTVFDSSVQRGTPASFPVNQVIPGWTEALQLMKVGDKWKLFIPANLAYGPQSPGAQIPANSMLIFEVELLGINK